MKNKKTTTKADLIEIYNSLFSNNGILKKAKFIEDYTEMKNNTANSQYLRGISSSPKDKKTKPNLIEQRQIISGLKLVAGEINDKAIELEKIAIENESLNEK